MQDRIEHRREKVEEKNVTLKEEENFVQRLNSERSMVKKLIYDQNKKLKKLRNINDRLKLTEEEKQEIERRTAKEAACIRQFEIALIIRNYMKARN